jgi:hypothetical protein
VAGFAEPAEIRFGDLVSAMLETGRRPTGVNGARHVSEPFAQAWRDLAGAQVARSGTSRVATSATSP